MGRYHQEVNFEVIILFSARLTMYFSNSNKSKNTKGLSALGISSSTYAIEGLGV